MLKWTFIFLLSFISSDNIGFLYKTIVVLFQCSECSTTSRLNNTFSFDTGEKYLKKQRKSFISALLTLIKKH